jgi:hypothetical protein
MARSAHNDGGYRQPPKDTRFKKGQSGNPSGRPKKVSSFKTDLAAELQEKLVLVENGKQRRVSKQKAFAKTLIAAAIQKDIRAVNALLACMRFFGVGSEEVVTEAADVSDLDLLENYLTQQRKKQAREADAAVNAKNTASNKRK